jgi:methionyl-tRNA synthetase
MNPSFYVTTPIYYVNDQPHIGSTYTTIIADVLARFHRLRQEEVCFATGTDENSQKNVQAMEKAGEHDLQAYLDRMANSWQQTWRTFDISFDTFIRTTESRHLAGVNRFWEAVKQSGDLEKRSYEGLYCVGCEGFKIETDLVEGRCPLHPNKELERLQEENWFFCLSRYREALLAHIEAHPYFVQPVSRRNEIKNYIREFMTDVSVSREVKKVSVGIPVPGDDSQRIYVWFDALINYLTAIGYGTDERRFAQFWPVNLHLVGKDIIKFHCALWPAMLMSAAKNDSLLRNEAGDTLLPKQVFAHGFLTANGQKISKSLGNAIDPHALMQSYGLDTMRYFLLREFPMGEDGDFSYKRLDERYQADLGNTLGNLLQRVVAMSRKYFDGKTPSVDPNTCKQAESGGEAWMGFDGLQKIRVQVEKAYAEHRPDVALSLIWLGMEDARSALVYANKYIEDTQPFKLAKTDVAATGRVLYALLETLRWMSWLIAPVMPGTSEKILAQLGLSLAEERAKGWNGAFEWGQLPANATLPEPTPLFPRREEA